MLCFTGMQTLAAVIVALLFLVALVLALRWLLVTTEGVFLGRRVVVWLYDLTAGRYDGIKQFDPDLESAFVIYPLRRRLPSPGAFVLDVATGTGRLPDFLLRDPAYNGRVIGLDASARMLAVAHDKLRPYGDRVLLVRQSALDLPFADGAFGGVTCLEALEFLPDDRAALREMARVLQPGGILLVSRRTGPEAGAFLHHVHPAEEFEALLAEIGLVDVQTQPWQLEYDLVWARRPA